MIKEIVEVFIFLEEMDVVLLWLIGGVGIGSIFSVEYGLVWWGGMIVIYDFKVYSVEFCLFICKLFWCLYGWKILWCEVFLRL